MTELIKDLVKDRQEAFEILINKIKEEVNNQTFDLEVNQMEKASLISKILDIFKPQNNSSKKIKLLKEDGNRKYEEYR